LLDEDADVAMEHARQSLQAFALRYQSAWTDGMRAKLGIVEAEDEDEPLAKGLTTLLEKARLDYTKAMRGLSAVARGDGDPFADVDGFDAWAAQWLVRLDREPGGRDGAAERMDAVNPVYIPRNDLVEAALDSAIEGDLVPIRRLLDAVTDPFNHRAGLERYAEPASEAFDEGFKTFCGT
jgi:uncharacterized protein YdiU (UPF0061 family)